MMTLRVGTLRAASALFPMVGCSPQRHIVLCLLFCVFRTQHATSLHASISTCPYTNIPTSSHPPHVYHIRYILRVGTLRAASALFPMVGCCPQRHIVLCLLFCILRTQHAASLHVHISIWQYSYISIWQYFHIPTCCNYN